MLFAKRGFMKDMPPRAETTSSWKVDQHPKAVAQRTDGCARPQTIVATDPKIFAEAVRCKELDKGQMKNVPITKVRCVHVARLALLWGLDGQGCIAALCTA